MVKRMTDPDWTEVEGTVGKTVYFTVYKADGVTVEDLSPYTETDIQLKVWENDGALKFEKDMTYFTNGIDGILQTTISYGDIARGDEGAYFFTIELVSGEENTATGVGGTETTFPTNLDEANEYWDDYTIRFTTGENADESRVITEYLLLNGQVTVSAAFPATPGADTFVVERTVPTVRGTLLITQGAPA